MENFANFYASTLNGSIDDSVTTVVVASSIGAPDVNFRVLVQDAFDDPTNRELMLVSAKAGEDFTVTRGIEGTTAVAHADGSFIAAVLTAGALEQLILDRVSNVQTDIVFIFAADDAASLVGQQLDVQIDFECQIESWTLLANASGSAVVDVWKDTYANYPPTDADSITDVTPPTISSATKATSDDMTGWDGGISIGDTLRANVDSNSGITRLSLILRVTRS